MSREVSQSVIGIIESKDNASSYYDGNNLNKTNVTATAQYTIPSGLTGDSIIAEACKFYNIYTWKAAATRYNDAWDGSKSIAEKTSTSSWRGYGDTSSATDCSAFVYSTLRHLGVRLTNFYDGTFGNGLDGRGGPVPLNARSWVDQSSKLPYHIKWENGDDIAQITDYTEGKEYGTWIEENNITTGTVVATLNSDQNGYNHIWFYIGKFDNINIMQILPEIDENLRGEYANYLLNQRSNVMVYKFDY